MNNAFDSPSLFAPRVLKHVACAGRFLSNQADDAADSRHLLRHTPACRVTRTIPGACSRSYRNTRVSSAERPVITAHGWATECIVPEREVILNDSGYEKRNGRAQSSRLMGNSPLRLHHGRRDPLQSGRVGWEVSVHLHLRDITAVDEAGKDLLRRLLANGVRLVASGVYTSYLMQSFRAGLTRAPIGLRPTSDDGRNPSLAVAHAKFGGSPRTQHLRNSAASQTFDVRPCRRRRECVLRSPRLFLTPRAR